MRIAPATLAALAGAAKQHGRNLTAEADRVLHQGLLVDKLAGAGLRPMVEVLMAFDHAGSEFARHYGVEGDWTQHPEAYGVALTFAVEKLAEQAPGPWKGKHIGAMIEQGFAMAEHRRKRAAGLMRGEGFLTPEERAAMSADAAAPATAIAAFPASRPGG